MATYELGPSSATAITLYPEYDYKRPVMKNESTIRTKSGKQLKYTWGSWTEISFSLEYVDGADAAIVNSWFENNTDLIFFVTSSTATEVNSVRIQGDESPLNQYNKPYDNYYKGKIELATY